MSRSWITLTLAITLLVPALAFTGGSEASPSTQATSTISIERVLDGSDTYMFRITEPHYWAFSDNSSFVVKGIYDKDDEIQRASAIVGVVQFANRGSCEKKGWNPCVTHQFGRTIEDVTTSTDPDENGDTRVQTGPGPGIMVETGHDHGAFSSLTTGKVWPGKQGFPPDPNDAGLTTYRYYVSIPNAERIKVWVNITSPHDISVFDEGWWDGGFDRWGEDFNGAGAHTPAATAYAGQNILCGRNCGETKVTMPAADPTNRIYAAIGQSWASHYVIHSHGNDGFCVDCVGTLPVAVAGLYGVEKANGDVFFGPAARASTGAAFPPMITVTGDRTPGNYWFFTDLHAQAGPGDILAVGTIGQIP